MCQDWTNSQVLGDAAKAIANGDSDAYKRDEAAKHSLAVACFTTPSVARWVEVSVLSLVCAIASRRLELPMKPLWPEGPMSSFWILLAADELVDVFARTVEHSLSGSARELHLHALVWALEISGHMFDLVSALTYYRDSGSADIATYLLAFQLFNIMKALATLVAVCRNTKSLFRGQHHP